MLIKMSEDKFDKAIRDIRQDTEAMRQSAIQQEARNKEAIKE